MGRVNRMAKFNRRSFLKATAAIAPAGLAPVSLHAALRSTANFANRKTNREVMSDIEFSASSLVRMRDKLAGHVSPGEVPGLVSLISQNGRTQVEALGNLSAEGQESHAPRQHLPHCFDEQADHRSGNDDSDPRRQAPVERTRGSVCFPSLPIAKC